MADSLSTRWAKQTEERAPFPFHHSTKPVTPIVCHRSGAVTNRSSMPGAKSLFCLAGDKERRLNLRDWCRVCQVLSRKRAHFLTHSHLYSLGVWAISPVRSGMKKRPVMNLTKHHSRSYTLEIKYFDAGVRGTVRSSSLSSFSLMKMHITEPSNGLDEHE